MARESETVSNYELNFQAQKITMHQLLARTSVSIAELKRSPSAVLERTGGEPVAVLKHNRPVAYLLSAATYETMLDGLDDIDLAELIKSRRDDPVVEINPDEL